MQNTENMIFHACACIVRLQVLICYVNTCWQRIISRFFKKSGFECCFWSAQCIETQLKTSDKVKTRFFISLNVRWWSLLENVVYYNTLRSNKAAILELEKAMFTGAIIVAMFTMITPGPHTHSKQSKTFHPKVDSKVNCEKKWVYYPKVIVWVLQMSIKHSEIYAM